MVLDSDKNNPLFQSPVGPKPEHILDIGTGKGNWAMYVQIKTPQSSRADQIQ
jgi:hypothetical protein